MVAGLFARWYIRNHLREHPSANDVEASYIEKTHAADQAAKPVTLSGDVLDFPKHRSA